MSKLIMEQAIVILCSIVATLGSAASLLSSMASKEKQINGNRNNHPSIVRWAIYQSNTQYSKISFQFSTTSSTQRCHN
jgi:hypothetical protein